MQRRVRTALWLPAYLLALALQGMNAGSPKPAAKPSKQASMKRLASKKEAATRVVHLNDGQPGGEFVGNGIRTAKYNVLTFAPLFLWEMFSRAAYFYFLIQARPACDPVWVEPRASFYHLMQARSASDRVWVESWVLHTFVSLQNRKYRASWRDMNA